MGKCTDPAFENKLHSFEMGMLSDDERKQFEEHLLECQSCFEQFQEFLPSARLLRQDPEFEKDATADTPQKSGQSSKLMNVTKFLAAAVIVLVIAVSVRWFVITEVHENVSQTIELFPMRDGGSAVIDLSLDGPVRISFFISDSAVTSADILIRNVDGDTIRSANQYEEIDEFGYGSIVLPLTELSRTHYIMTIVYPCAADSVQEREYTFRAR